VTTLDGTLDTSRLAEVQSRLTALRALLEKRGTRSAFLIARRNFAWLTAGGSNHVVLESEMGEAGVFVNPDEAVVLASNIEARRLADEELAGTGLEVIAVDWWRRNGVIGEASRRGRAGLVSDDDLEPDLETLRSRLSAFDAERLAILGGETTRAMETALATVEPMTTEVELCARLLATLEDIRAPVLLAAADDRIARYRHPLPGDYPIRTRVMLVLVAERWGLHVALTRFRDLEPRTPDLEQRFAAVGRVQDVLHDATRASATLGEVFAAAQAAYADVGYPNEWQLHHQGGTIAYRGRERIAVPDDRTVIEPGMAFAWNPSITGAKVEETFVLGENDARRIVTLP
jgi:Xaa-Pro aminopeptidase